jgi:H/ACA ribonucleoprotein complex subunit 4
MFINHPSFFGTMAESKELLPFEKFKREVVIKREGETDESVGCYPHERTIPDLIDMGVVNIDKPKGPTSHMVSDFVQRILGIEKAGHSGTLDPAVTGVLPIALGRGTRIVQALLPAGKEYVAVMHLHKEVPETDLRRVCDSFVGAIEQLPPIKSSVKRQLRIRNVYYLNIYEIDGQDVLFKTGTQAGTYIRKLIHDIGKKIGCGAHMAELRRTKAGPFTEDSLVTLQNLADAFHYWKENGKEEELRALIQPVENGIAHLPKIWVFDQTVSALCHGIDLKVPGISKFTTPMQKGEMVALLTLKGELIALGTAHMDAKELQKAEKGVAVATDKVFMHPEVYSSKRVRPVAAETQENLKNA